MILASDSIFGRLPRESSSQCLWLSSATYSRRLEDCSITYFWLARSLLGNWRRELGRIMWAFFNIPMRSRCWQQHMLEHGQYMRLKHFTHQILGHTELRIRQPDQSFTVYRNAIGVVISFIDNLGRQSAARLLCYNTQSWHDIGLRQYLDIEYDSCIFKVWRGCHWTSSTLLSAQAAESDSALKCGWLEVVTTTSGKLTARKEVGCKFFANRKRNAEYSLAKTGNVTAPPSGGLLSRSRSTTTFSNSCVTLESVTTISTAVTSILSTSLEEWHSLFESKRVPFFQVWRWRWTRFSKYEGFSEFGWRLEGVVSAHITTSTIGDSHGLVNLCVMFQAPNLTRIWQTLSLTQSPDISASMIYNTTSSNSGGSYRIAPAEESFFE